MRLNRRDTSRHSKMDLTPMIDVVFQLIIFFMVTSHLGDLRRSEIDLPREEGVEEQLQREPAMIVDITPDGSYLIESTPTPIEEIERIARAGVAAQADDDGFDVLVRPDRLSSSAVLDRLLVRLSAAGVSHWKMGTREGGAQ